MKCTLHILSRSSSRWSLRRAVKSPSRPEIFRLNGEVDYKIRQLQSNLDGSNTDGSFTMANSNSFFSPYEILPIAQENKYLRKFSYFIVKLYVVCTH